jgi:hypothetical protein
MPSFIELDSQSSFSASSNVGRVVFGVNTNNQAVLTDSSGVTTTIGGSPLYKVYTALLTQNGGSNPISANYLNLLPLIIGQTYYISDNSGGADFISVGAPNNDIGTYFVATGTTPDNWGNGELTYNEGCPVVTVLENTIGNLYFAYKNPGDYRLYASPSTFIYGKTTILNGTTTGLSIFNRLINPDGTGFGTQQGYLFEYIDDTTIILKSLIDADTTHDSILTGQITIEIRVYN